MLPDPAQKRSIIAGLAFLRSLEDSCRYLHHVTTYCCILVHWGLDYSQCSNPLSTYSTVSTQSTSPPSCSFPSIFAPMKKNVCGTCQRGFSTRGHFAHRRSTRTRCPFQSLPRLRNSPFDARQRPGAASPGQVLSRIRSLAPRCTCNLTGALITSFENSLARHVP